ncbi:thiamine pyrophosphokinase 1-like [Diadema antillarum]|uniref:thiamine pyrophosphokinase 1-like n=1 Tax=Diadema antillarum TaxID=105358 RepID=UPI003A8C4D23
MLHIGWLCGLGLSRLMGSPSEMAEERIWRPLACFEDDSKDKVAVIALNRPLADLQPLLAKVWDRAVLRAAADGASNRLTDLPSQEGSQRYIPDLLTGDFDSIRPEVKLALEREGSTVIPTPDQDYTDFTKCLKIVLQRLQVEAPDVDSIVVFGAFGGRLDQTLANINTVLTATSYTKLPIYLIGDASLACVLSPGAHRIEVDTGLEAKWCGLVPVKCQCDRVKTTGLKWNIENQSMQYGGLISTSNTYAPQAGAVTVATDQPLLWTMGIKVAEEEDD